MKRSSNTITLIFLILAAPPAWSDEPDDPTLGGPSGVTGELDQAEDILDAYRIDNRELALKPWYDWKTALRERSGFSFGVNAQVLYLDASGTLGAEDDAAGGIYRVQGEWELFDRGGDHPGSIVFRLENRSKIGSGIPPASLRGEIGAAATDPGFGYSDKFGTDFSVLAWQQFFANQRAAFAVGLLDFSAYVDAFYYQTISRGFVNRSFILNPTLATTGVGALGGVAKGFVSDHFWIGGGFYDANAKSGDPSFDTWDSGELLKHAEVGWTPDISRRGTDRAVKLLAQGSAGCERNACRLRMAAFLERRTGRSLGALRAGRLVGRGWRGAGRTVAQRRVLVPHGISGLADHRRRLERSFRQDPRRESGQRESPRGLVPVADHGQHILAARPATDPRSGPEPGRGQGLGRRNSTAHNTLTT